MARGSVEGRDGRARAPRKLILVLCEGRETEPTYLSGFRQALRGKATLKIRSPNEKDPIGLARAAKRARERYEIDADDRLWIVFDADHSSQAQIDGAATMAKLAGAELALSNPCFELWFLLHFEDCQIPLDLRETFARLERWLSGYSKSADYFATLLPYIDQALRRARAAEARHASPLSLEANPSSGLWRLVEELRVC